MQAKSSRRSVDLSAYPDLVVVYLGLRLTGWRGILTMLHIGPGLSGIAKHKPDGLLAHETVSYGFLHTGMRQYWRDMESLERFTRSEPHKGWWKKYMHDTGGTGFWHETYARRGGMEAIYVGMPSPIGFGLFAEARTPEGPFLNARQRLAA